MSHRRSFVRELLGAITGAAAVVRAVRQIDTGTRVATPTLEREIDARWTATQLGEPRCPNLIEGSITGLVWMRVRSMHEARVGGYRYVRALEIASTRPPATIVWLMEYRDGHVVQWTAEHYGHLRDAKWVDPTSDQRWGARV